MIQLTEQELQDLMMNLYNRKNSFNTLLEVREYIKNEINKVKSLSLSGVIKSFYCCIGVDCGNSNCAEQCERCSKMAQSK